MSTETNTIPVQFATSVAADFARNTWELALDGGFTVAAGRYAIVPEDVYKHMCLSNAFFDVSVERVRQISKEGCTPEHDDQHEAGDMATAGACYAADSDAYPNEGQPPPLWPWASEWWKPKDYRRDLVRAAALIIAEIERLDRAAANTGSTGHSADR